MQPFAEMHFNIFKHAIHIFLALCVLGVSRCAMFCRGHLGSTTERGQAATDLLPEWTGTGPPG